MLLHTDPHNSWSYTVDVSLKPAFFLIQDLECISQLFGYIQEFILQSCAGKVMHTSYRSFATRVSQLKNLAILSYWYRKKHLCRCTINRYSVITQFAKLSRQRAAVSSLHSWKIIALQNLYKSPMKNHTF